MHFYKFNSLKATSQEECNKHWGGREGKGKKKHWLYVVVLQSYSLLFHQILSLFQIPQLSPGFESFLTEQDHNLDVYKVFWIPLQYIITIIIICLISASNHTKEG